MKRTLCSLALLTLALTGCQTAKQPDEYDANGKKIEYVYYTPTGSHIPIKVRKDLLKTSDAESAKVQAALGRAVLSGTGQDKQPGGL